MAIIVRQARQADRDSIQPFIAEAFGPIAAYKDVARWTWQYVNYPSAPKSEAALPVWIALDGEKVVGQIAVQRTALSVHGKVLQAGWIVDVMVLPAYRGQGIGHRLYEAVTASRLVLLTLTMAKATRRMAERLGAITLPEVYQLSRWRRPTGRDVARYLIVRTQHRESWSLLAKSFIRLGGAPLLALLVRGAAAFLDVRGRAAEKTRLQLKPIARFGREVDAIWASQPVGIAGVPRTHAYLNWRFADCPRLHYEMFLVTEHDQLVGYLVLRRTEAVELRQGIIADALARKNCPILWKGLLEAAVEHFGYDVASVEVATSDPAVKAIMHQLGFFRTRTLHPTIVCGDARRLDDLRSVERWWFTKGDHDWDQIHLA